MLGANVPRFYFLTFVSAVMCVIVCRIIISHEETKPLRITKERKLATGTFSDTLAPKDTCADLMSLTDVLEDEDGDSLGGVLSGNYTLATYFDDPTSGTQAMIVYSKDKRFAAAVFRSTELFSLDDWKTNLNIDLVPTGIPSIPSDVELHEGYFDAVFNHGLADLFESKLIELINDPALDLEYIYLTGHSMGGALAHILGSYLAGKNNDLNFRVITFGQPNVGNSGFENWTENILTNLSVFRFVNRNDVVPRILGFRYKNAGHVFHIQKRKSTLYYNQDGGNGYAGVPASWYLAGSLLQHTSWSYARFFERKAQIAKFWPQEFKAASACTWWQFWC